MKVRIVSETTVRTERLVDVDLEDFNIEPHTPEPTAVKYINAALSGFDVDSPFNDEAPDEIRQVLYVIRDTVPDYEETYSDIILRAERVD